MTVGLTPRQRDLLAYIIGYQRRHGGASPSYDEMRAPLGGVNRSSVHRLIRGLVERGYIRQRSGLSFYGRNVSAARSITVLRGLPLRFIPMADPEPGDAPATAYRGPYPNLMAPTCAEWMDLEEAA